MPRRDTLGGVQCNACAVVIDDEGRILLGLCEDFEVWGLPGGHIEAGETPEQAAHREVGEELGIEIEIERMVGRYVRLGGRQDVESYAFAAHVSKGEPVPDEVETLKVAWFEVSNLPPLMLWWNKPPIFDAVTGAHRLQRTFSVPSPLGAVTRTELYALRDRSGLGRSDFYAYAFPEPSEFPGLPKL